MRRNANKEDRQSHYNGNNGSNGEPYAGSPDGKTKRFSNTVSTVFQKRMLVLTIVASVILGATFKVVTMPPAGGPIEPPASLIVHGKESTYAAVPSQYRKTFYIEMGTKFRRTVARAFRNRGWKKSDKPDNAHIIWDKQVEEDRFDQLKPWQRYSYFPGFHHWDRKDSFIRGFEKYRAANPKKKLLQIPDTYRLKDKHGVEAFMKRIHDGGMDRPWVLKLPDVNNGKGVQMLGPNSDELKDVVKKIKAGDAEIAEENYIIQSYICNELTWFEKQKFDLRFYWMVASVDPLIVLYHDGYVRVGNAMYDESDFSETAKHLTTHTFLADEIKGTTDELKELVRGHYKKNKRKLSKRIKIDPYDHIRNQFKETIAETVAAFKDVTFGNDKEWKYTAQNSFGFYGIDFVLDKDLDIWYVEAQAGPGMEEEFDFRVELHRDMLRSMIDTVDEIQVKLEADPTRSVLPLHNLGGWDIVYAGTEDENWMYQYEGYKRNANKKSCGLGGKHTPKDSASAKKLRH